MLKIIFKISLLLSLIIMPAHANLITINKYVGNAEKISQGQFKFLFWTVFDASLYAPDGKYDPQQPFALRLDYFLNLKGKLIASASIKEIRQQGFSDEEKLQKWGAAMTDIFPSVKGGDYIIGIRNAEGDAVFYYNGNYIGTIADKQFTIAFFNIWLGEKTSRPGLRKKLLRSQ